MLTFLFWNLNKKPLRDSVVRLAGRHEVDVLMLAECAMPPGELLKALNPNKPPKYHLTASRKLIVFTRFAREHPQRQHDDNGERYVVFRVTLPNRQEFLLAIVHFASKLYEEEYSQCQKASEFGRRLREIESQAGHTHTMLIGDLNMDPFEKGVVSASGLHAVMTQEIASRRHRFIDTKKYPFFYNPMWCHFGDGRPGPPGTYYYYRGGHAVHFWHIFDQVLLRSDLLRFFRSADLKILTGDGKRSFLSKRGLPDLTTASDHLPILFGLNL